MKNKIQSLNQVGRVFDTPIAVLEKEVKKDGNGVEREIWKEKYKLFACAKNLHGKEYELAKQINNRKTIKLIIKYGPKIDESMQIRFQGKFYDIDNIDNIGFQNEEIEIKAIERVMRR